MEGGRRNAKWNVWQGKNNCHFCNFRPKIDLRSWRCSRIGIPPNHPSNFGDPAFMEIPKCTNRKHAQQGWHTAAKRMKADTESIASNQKDNFDAMRGEQNNTTSLQNYNGGGSGRWSSPFDFQGPKSKLYPSVDYATPECENVR